MKILFDQNISFRLINKIVDIFPLAKQVKELNLENSADKEIWEFARDNEYTIVTFDSDFYDFSIVWGHPPSCEGYSSFAKTKISRIFIRFFTSYTKAQ